MIGERADGNDDQQAEQERTGGIDEQRGPRESAAARVHDLLHAIASGRTEHTAGRDSQEDADVE